MNKFHYEKLILQFGGEKYPILLLLFIRHIRQKSNTFTSQKCSFNDDNLVTFSDQHKCIENKSSQHYEIRRAIEKEKKKDANTCKVVGTRVLKKRTKQG